MELYFAPLACSLAVRIVAEETGVPLTYREVDLYTKRLAEGGGDYLAVNPRGQVPVLVMDDGDRLAEVLAIVRCIADTSSQRGLLGATARERYRVLEGLSFVATEIHKRLLYVLGTQSSSLEARVDARQAAPAVFSELARILGNRPFYTGERFTVADAYLAWAFITARIFRLDLSPVESYVARLTAFPSVAHALAIETPLARASWHRQRAVIGEPPWLRGIRQPRHTESTP